MREWGCDEVMGRIGKKIPPMLKLITVPPLFSRKVCLKLKGISNKVISKDSLAGNYISILNKLKIPRGENYFPLNSNLIRYFLFFSPNDSADHRLLHILFL